MAKSLEKTRREAYETLYEAKELIDNLIQRASKETYKDLLEDVKDRLAFAKTGDDKLKSKQFKDFVKHAREVYKLLKHELWNKRRIKKKIQQLQKDLDKIGL